MLTIPAMARAATTSRPVPGQGRVDVDGVRHDGGAEHAGGQQDGVRALEAGHEPGEGCPRIGRADEQPGQEADGEDAEQEHDDEFEGPLLLPGLHREQEHRHRADYHGTQGEGEAEQQVQRERPTHHLGEVGGGGHDFGLQPEGAAPERPEPLAQDLRQALAGDDPELGGLVLDQDGHDVGDDEDPHQQVTVPRAGGQVGGHVSRVHVGNRRHERRAQEGDQCPAGTWMLVSARALRRLFVSRYVQHCQLP
jgi:hypothetical protein